MTLAARHGILIKTAVSFSDGGKDMENEQRSLFQQAKWITRSPWIEWRTENDPERFPPSPYLARSFEVKKPPQKAVLHIAGLGQAA